MIPYYYQPTLIFYGTCLFCATSIGYIIFSKPGIFGMRSSIKNLYAVCIVVVFLFSFSIAFVVEYEFLYFLVAAALIGPLLASSFYEKTGSHYFLPIGFLPFLLLLIAVYATTPDSFAATYKMIASLTHLHLNQTVNDQLGPPTIWEDIGNPRHPRMLGQ